MSLSGGARPHLSTRPSASSSLWGHLMRSTVSQVPTSSAASATLGRHAAPIVPFDKAGASTRILLNDTQAHLEKFTERVGQLAIGFDNAKQELSTMQKLYQHEHEQLVDRMIGLTNRCQTELQKVIGTPAQTTEVHELSKDLNVFAARLEALDKKIDTLNALNQTQAQALQTIQDQQGQILSALLPVIPLLQSVPLHIENARNQVKDSISELQRQVSVHKAAPLSAVLLNGDTPQSVKRAQSRSSDLVNTRTSDRKKRRLDEVSNPAPNDPNHSPAVQVQRTPSRISAHPRNEVLSPESPPSTLTLRSSHRSIVRSPLVDLLSTNHHTVLDLKKASLSDHPHPVMTTQSVPLATGPIASLPGSLCTPTRGRTFYAPPQKSSPMYNNTPTPGPSGGSKLLSTSVKPTPQLYRSSRHSSHAVQVPVVHGTPVVGRSPTAQASPANVNNLRRANTAREEISKGNISGLVAQSYDMRPPSMPPSAGKPMSLKDRRALLFLSEDVVRNEGKRFIPLDDEDDEDIGVVE